MTDWHEITDMEEAKGEILTSYRSGGPWSDQVAGIEALPALMDRPWESALDFGCGVGRNLPGLQALNPEADLYGYDYPNMVTLADDYLADGLQVTLIEHPLDNLAGLRFDLVIACLVFQHMPLAELDSALRILREALEPDGRLYVTSRGWLDHGRGNVWPHILAEFEPVTPLDPAFHEERHQLVLFRPRGDA